jgi:hypothetical protein
MFSKMKIFVNVFAKLYNFRENVYEHENFREFFCKNVWNTVATPMHEERNSGVRVE